MLQLQALSLCLPRGLFHLMSRHNGAGLKGLGFILISTLSAGCLNMSTLQTGQVLEHDQGEVTIATHMTTGGQEFFKPEIRYTHGLPYDLEAGLAVAGDRSATIHGRHQIIGSEEDSRVAVSLGLSATYLRVQDVEDTAITCDESDEGLPCPEPEPTSPFAHNEGPTFDLMIPLILSYHLDKTGAFYLSAKHLTRVDAEDFGVNEYFVGIGAGFQFGDKSGVRVEFTEIVSLTDTSRDGVQVSAGVFF